MSSRVGTRSAAVLFCIAAQVGCGAGVDDASTSSEATQCSYVGTSSWFNQAIPAQTGRFHVEMTAVPSAGNIDAVVGLSTAATTKWAGLAAIIRFNPQGHVDARAGSDYRADQDFTYRAGTTYYLRFDVDLNSATYSAWIGERAGAYSLIGRDYPFRTEQAGASQLENVASFVNPETGPGTLQVCGISATSDATTADGCTVNTANAGFQSFPLATAANVQHVSVRARVQQANMDGVVGLTHGDADDYNDFAASVRFYTNGMIEARDGDTYRADIALPYAAGDRFELRFVIDWPSKTYSVYVTDENTDGGWTLASNYHFRPQQAGVTSLDRVATVVASSAGRVDMCGAGLAHTHNALRSVRSGIWSVGTLADNSAVISDGATTVKVNAQNVPVASTPTGGAVAVAPDGSAYVARLANYTLTLTALSPQLATRWTHNYSVSGAALGDMTVASNGQLAIVVGDQRGGQPANREVVVREVVRVSSAGTRLASLNLPYNATTVGLGTTSYGVARAFEGSVALERYAYDTQALLASRTINGDFDVSRIAIAPNGSLVISGELSGPVDFGTGETINPNYGSYESVSWDSYAAAFTPTFETRFAANMSDHVEGLAVNDQGFVISYFQWTQLMYTCVLTATWDGAITHRLEEEAYLGAFGHPGTIALGADGRLYLNEWVGLGGPATVGAPMLVTVSL